MATFRDAVESDVSRLAAQHWASDAAGQRYDPDLVRRVYDTYLVGGGGSRHGGAVARQALDYSGYLEHYLWPHFSLGVGFEHVASIVMMVNEKGREGAPMWATFQAQQRARAGEAGGDAQTTEKRFGAFFLRALMLRLERTLRPSETDAVILFTINVFQSLECDLVRRLALRLVNIPLWLSVSPTRVALEVSDGRPAASLRSAWDKAQKAHAGLLAAVGAQPELEPLLSAAAVAASSAATEDRLLVPAGFFARLGALGTGGGPVQSSPVALLQRLVDASFLPSLLRQFVAALGATPGPPPLPLQALPFLTRSLELFVDLLAQMPTRRFSRLLISDAQIVVLCRRSPLYSQSGVGGGVSPASSLFAQLTDALDFYVHFSVDEHSGAALGEAAMLAATFNRVQTLQWLAYTHFAGASRDMKELALSATGRLTGRKVLASYLECLSDDQLLALARRLRLVPLSSAVSSRLALVPPPLPAATQPAAPATAAAAAPDAPVTKKRGRQSKADIAAAASAAASAAAAAEEAKVAAAAAASAAASEIAARVSPRTLLQALSPQTPVLLGPLGIGGALGSGAPAAALDRPLLSDVLLTHHEVRQSDLAAINALSLYPDERLLWDPSRVPANGPGPGGASAGGGAQQAHGALALPKLNLQFLSLYDLFHRCFVLYRLESAVGIRADVVEAVTRVAARSSATQDSAGFAAAATRFTGWSRMAVPIGAAAAAEAQAAPVGSTLARGGPRGSGGAGAAAAAAQPGSGFRITEVLPPRVGETVPARVSAEVVIDLGRYAPYIRAEWDQLREHDAVFLLAIESVTPLGSSPEDT